MTDVHLERSTYWESAPTSEPNRIYFTAESNGRVIAGASGTGATLTSDQVESLAGWLGEQRSRKPIGARKLAAQLGVHENTIRNWEQRGLIRTVRLPSGVRRFPPEEVERMRHEMLTQYAPATEMPKQAKTPTKGHTLTPEEYR